MSAKIGRPNILITSVQVPFTRGGAEILVDGLRRELAARDFSVDIVQLPFSAQPIEQLAQQVAMWRALDLRMFNGKKVDLVIATKFPSYIVSHPNKVVWLVHQHRQIYDLYGTRYCDFQQSPEDEAIRRLIMEADRKTLAECKSVYTISGNVKARVEKYLDVPASVLTPPLPLGQAYRSGEKGGYILSVGRICSIKRVDLMIKAMPHVHESLRLKIVGQPDEPATDTYLKSELDKHHLWDRVDFLGRVSDEELLGLYANAFGVYYAPFDEDYGFVTLEALASTKPVVTARDSGGVLEFILDEENGLVTEPNEQAIARAFNRLVESPELYQKIVANQGANTLTNTWDEVVSSLTSSLFPEKPKTEATNLPIAASISIEDRKKKPEPRSDRADTAEVFFKREAVS